MDLLKMSAAAMVGALTSFVSQRTRLALMSREIRALQRQNQAMMQLLMAIALRSGVEKETLVAVAELMKA